MSELLAGPHFWILLLSLGYMSFVVATIVRVVGTADISAPARVAWIAAVVAVPLGGALVFWGARGSRKGRSTSAM